MRCFLHFTVHFSYSEMHSENNLWKETSKLPYLNDVKKQVARCEPNVMNSSVHVHSKISIIESWSHKKRSKKWIWWYHSRNYMLITFSLAVLFSNIQRLFIFESIAIVGMLPGKNLHRFYTNECKTQKS